MNNKKKLWKVLFGLLVLMPVLIFSACGGDEDEDNVINVPVEPPVLTDPVTASVTIVAKSQVSINTVDFSITSYHGENAVFKVYGDETGTTVHSTVTAGLLGYILTLTSSEADIAPGDYWVTVTDSPKTESTRLKLTINPYVKSETPQTDDAVISKTSGAQTSVAIDINNTYDAGAAWRVYSTETGNAFASVNPVFADGKLTLSSMSSISAGNYWITVWETGKIESDRLCITVKGHTLFVLDFENSDFNLDSITQVAGGAGIGVTKDINTTPAFIHSGTQSLQINIWTMTGFTSGWAGFNYRTSTTDFMNYDLRGTLGVYYISFWVYPANDDGMEVMIELSENNNYNGYREFHKMIPAGQLTPGKWNKVSLKLDDTFEHPTGSYHLDNGQLGACPFLRGVHLRQNPITATASDAQSDWYKLYFASIMISEDGSDMVIVEE